MPPGLAKLQKAIAIYTFLWLAVYFPLETYVTWYLAGLPGLLTQATS